MLGPSHRRRDELIVAPPRIDSFPGRHRKAWMDADFQRTICRHASDHRVKCLLGYGSGIDHSEEIVVGGKRWPHLRASPAQQGPFSWVEPLQQRGQIRSQGEDRKRLTAVTQPIDTVARKKVFNEPKDDRVHVYVLMGIGMGRL